MTARSDPVSAPDSFGVMDALHCGMVAVSDPDYGGVFCLVSPADLFGGEAHARARAQDIADLFNWWRANSMAESYP